MKINKKSLKAIRANVKLSKAQKTVKAGKKNTKRQTKAVDHGKVKAREVVVALLSGARGFAARQVERLTYSDGAVTIRALQNNLGLALKDGAPAEVVGDKLTAKAPRDARVQLGGYVNGRNTGARVEFLTQAQFDARSKPAIVHWSADDNGVHGRYVGNPSQKGMCAVAVKYGNQNYVWHMEQDSNANNKHERGAIKPVKTGQVLVATK